jgi:beta-galactosidase
LIETSKHHPTSLVFDPMKRIYSRMKPALTLLLFCLVLSSKAPAQEPDSLHPLPRPTYNFNPDWKVFVGDPAGAEAVDFQDSAWKTVTLPYAWNEDSAFKVPIAAHPTGIAWYRKHFKLPSTAAGKKVFLEFEGIRQAGEFYLNGKHIGRHENGITAFGFDLTDLIRPGPGENVLAVRIDNDWDYREKSTGSTFQWANRNFNANFGGIPKNVKLHVTGKLYQTLPLYTPLGTVGTYIYAQDFDVAGKSATITIESEIKNEEADPRTLELEVVIEDMAGKVIKTFGGSPLTVGAGKIATASASARVQGLEFWSWGYGYLYNVYSILKIGGKPVDVVRTRTGFRQTEFGHGMVKLNDRVLQMKGYAQRTSNEWPAMGSAVPAWLSDFSNGLIVQGNGNLVRWMHITPSKQDVESCDRVGLIEAMPAGDAESDSKGRQWQQRVEVMRDAIIYNRNNPSILFYESGNTGVSEDHLREMKAVRDKYDQHGGRAAGCREMLGSEVAEYGGEMLYINKSARLPFWAMEYSRDEALRKYWDEYSPPYHKDGDGPPYRNAPAAEYNRNQDSFAVEDVTRWFDYWRERPGTGTRVSSGGVNIIFSDSNTHCRGAENYRRSGEVDAMRIPKDGFWAHQVMWDGWVDVERPRIHIIGHWNYAPGTKKNVYVVSSADQVQLFVNGKSLGEGKQSNRFLFTFPNVEWQPGTIHAVGLDAHGKKLCEVEKQTAGDPAAINLSVTTSPNGLRADGADVALVEAEVVDAQGRRCPTALNLIDFNLTGPAEWRGGIAQGTNNFILSKSLPVECGVNRVLIRSTREAGKIILTAASPGLKEAKIELESKSFEVSGGIATTLPADKLPSNLGRGPTPLGPSFHVSRIPVVITNAIAGANATNAAASFDDDETTIWSNDKKLSTAWIQYEFARAAQPAEVELKLSGWRQRTYPLRISIDGQEVFRGSTPRSLGYVTLALKPVTGRSMKIELIKGADVREGFNITELDNSKNDATKSEDNAGGTLSIVEFECYEKPAN